MIDNPKHKALELAANALKWTDEAIQKFTSHKSLSEPIDCKPGCHYCCFNQPVVTPPEALLLGHHVEQTFTHQEKQELIHRITNVVEITNSKSLDEIAMLRYELSCIFLKDGMCMVYQVRPVVCRTCTSISAEHCKMIFESRNHRARLKCYKHIREIFQTVQTELIDSCQRMGCQSDLLYLAEGIKDYLKHPRPIALWLKGESIFQPPVF